MTRILREPLLHFLLLGAGIFAAYGLIASDPSGRAGRIVVTRGDLASMQESFVRTRQRPPTPAELGGLIHDRIQDEVYAREAVALGLDQGDQIIRRRLRQKMEFVSEGVAPVLEPTDADLQPFLDLHAADYAAERRLSFRQVFLDPAIHRSTLDAEVASLLARLNQEGGARGIDRLGDPLMLEHEFDRTTVREVAGLFGAQFAAALDSVPAGRWVGPVASGYGVHLVSVSAGAGNPVPPLAEVREAVRRDWLDAQQREAAARFYRALLQKYAVIIDTSSTATRPRGLVGAR